MTREQGFANRSYIQAVVGQQVVDDVLFAVIGLRFTPVAEVAVKN